MAPGPSLAPGLTLTDEMVREKPAQHTGWDRYQPGHHVEDPALHRGVGTISEVAGAAAAPRERTSGAPTHTKHCPSRLSSPTGWASRCLPP